VRQEDKGGGGGRGMNEVVSYQALFFLWEKGRLLFLISEVFFFVGVLEADYDQRLSLRPWGTSAARNVNHHFSQIHLTQALCRSSHNLL